VRGLVNATDQPILLDQISTDTLALVNQGARMHPTLRNCLKAAAHLASRIAPSLRASRFEARAKVQRRAKPVLDGLEERVLLYFSVDAAVVPSTLWPPNNKYIPVTITGTAREFSIEGNKQVFQNLPGPKRANFIVTDEYRRDEPYGPIPLTHQGGGTYTFTFTTNLQASRKEQFAAGRRYYFSLAVGDDDGWGAKELVVQVPKSPDDRGMGPLRPWPSKAREKLKEMKSMAHTRAAANQQHPRPPRG